MCCACLALPPHTRSIQLIAKVSSLPPFLSVVQYGLPCCFREPIVLLRANWRVTYSSKLCYKTDDSLLVLLHSGSLCPGVVWVKQWPSIPLQHKVSSHITKNSRICLLNNRHTSDMRLLATGPRLHSSSSYYSHRRIKCCRINTKVNIP